MTIKDLIDANIFKTVNTGDEIDRQIQTVFCCDLLSIAMGRAPADCAWVTVMGNINTLAVSSLADCACIILAEGCNLDGAAAAKASAEGISVFSTELPVFEAALMIHERLHAKA